MGHTIINGIENQFDVPAYIGSVANGNYFFIDDDGSPRLYGSAVQWKDINMPSALLTLPLSSIPGRDEFVDSQGSDTGIDTFAFDVGEYVSSGFEIQHDYDEGTDLYFHVHWQGKGAVTGTDRVQWEIKYTIVGEHEAPPPVTTITAESTYDTEGDFVRTDFDPIDGSGIEIGNQLLFTFKRIAATQDEYGGDALISTVGIHYQVNSFGSNSMVTK